MTTPTIHLLPQITPLGSVFLEPSRKLYPHEQVSVERLRTFGYDIICKRESHIPDTHTADIIWQGEEWEMKAIKGNSRHSVRNNLRKAKHQSKRIIIDISASSIKFSSAINHVKDHMRRNSTIRETLILSKSQYCVLSRKDL